MTRWDWLFKRGGADYRRGKPVPATPDDNIPADEDARWYGYMLARAKVLMRRFKVEDALRPDPHDPRPRKAA